MRTEKTIRDKLDSMLLGKYYRGYRSEIATLFWVLGIVPSIRKGYAKAIELENATTDIEGQAP